MPLSALFDGYATPDAAERASILIVDDLPEKLLVFETILADLDQHLVIARSGSEALREVLRQQFAVILMDVNMPGIDGLETARLIRGYRRSAHTPIIFVTAYADELQTAQGYSLGAVDYILSPVIPDVLRSKVLIAYALLLFGLGFSIASLSADRGQTAISLLNLVLLLVPLFSIVFSTIYLYNLRDFYDLLLAQPLCKLLRLLQRFLRFDRKIIDVHIYDVFNCFRFVFV